MYKGIELTSLDSYIFDILPYNKEIDLDKVRRIETSLRDDTSGKEQRGITYEEASYFLDWMTYNARTAATSNIPESAMTAPLAGACGPTQSINTSILQKMGLDVKPFNMGECVGKTPMTEEDRKRIENGWYSTNVRHAVTIVNLPIEENGIVKLHTYLLDPTFRQFCLKENCVESNYWNEERIRKGHVAPHPAYFLTEEYLRKQGASEEKIKASYHLAQMLISRGYIELTEENAKIYGDAFARAGIREEFKDVNLTMTGLDYIREFENRKAQILEWNLYDGEFSKTPLEIEEKKGIFDRIKEFLTRKNRKCLPEGAENVAIPENKRKKTNALEIYRVEDYQHPCISEIEDKTQRRTRER